jgi:hypothetical protein
MFGTLQLPTPGFIHNESNKLKIEGLDGAGKKLSVFITKLL